MIPKAMEWLSDRLRILDQSKLPWEETTSDLTDYRDVASAINEMKVRGAPAIGITAAYAIALAAQTIQAENRDDFIDQLEQVMQTLTATRPTAVNLFRAIDRMRGAAAGDDVPEIREALVNQAKQIHREETEATRQLSESGASLVKDGFTTLTHCNAGSLATAGYGTALGVIRAATEQGKRLSVFATETRPLFQGARLTTWELKQEGIPVTLITDSAAGYYMQQGKIDCVIVGADRIAANGDVANKIGTYTLAVLAKEHRIAFYVAAPTSSIDLSLRSGDGIPIEERDPQELTRFRGIPIAPEGVEAANPGFDVTPHAYISAIITESGIIRKPYGRELLNLARR